MTNTLKQMAIASGFAVVVLGATPAFATTTAGNTINNQATVAYNVGAVVQTPVLSNINAIIVDRKVAFTVTEEGSVTTAVSPAQVGAVTTFRITNNSNAVLDFDLASFQGAAAHGGTDNFDATITNVFVDNLGVGQGTQGVYDAGIDTALYADNIAQDGGFVRVFVVATIPSTQVNGDVSGVILQATALEVATLGTKGGALTGVLAATVAQTAGMDTVLSDAVGVAAGDLINDGKHSARDDYTVGAPVLTVTKQSRVLSDPVNGALTATNFPKMIPGAVVEYCIIVANSNAAVPADTITITDPLATTITFVPGSIRQSGTYTAGVCNLDGTAGGSLTGTSPNFTVNGALGQVTSTTTKTLLFQVTIN
jgi:uncharacterized repeat protein (TIGR01451 family)